MAVPVSPDLFKLKSPCVDCPFRKIGGVRHGAYQAEAYARHFTVGHGATFPCHRSVPAHIDRRESSQWQEGQQFCAGGLIFAEQVGQRSLVVQACIDKGAHDPATLQDRDTVFDTVNEMARAHAREEEE